MSVGATSEKRSLRVCWGALVVALAFALFTTFGIEFDFGFDASRSIWGNIKTHAPRAIACLLVSFACYYVIVERLYRAIDRVQPVAKNPVQAPRVRDWLVYVVILALAWIPYAIVCYPASSTGYDYFWQLTQGMGVFPLAQHHPVFGSLVYGLLYRIGFALGGTANAGLFFTTLFQVAFMAAAIGFALVTLRAFNCPRVLRIVLLVFFALCPVYAGHAVWLIKDSLFASAGCILFVQFFWWTHSVRGTAPNVWFASLPAVVVMAVVFSLIRNGALPVAALLFVVLAVYSVCLCGRRQLKGIVAGLAVLVVVTQAWGAALTHAGAYPGSIREALATPSRQVVNTLRLHPNAINAEEKALLLDVYEIRGDSLDKLIAKYDYRGADPIRTGYFEGKAGLVDFLELWAKLGIKHPGAYADAALRGSYGYWWPLFDATKVLHPTPFFNPKTDFGPEGLKNKMIKEGSGSAVHIFILAGLPVDETYVDYAATQNPDIVGIFDAQTKNEAALTALNAAMTKLKQAPVLSVFLAPGIYVFMLLFAIGYLVSRRRTGALLFPLLLIVLIACLSPVNPYMRYALPFVVLAPFLLGTCFTDEFSDPV